MAISERDLVNRLLKQSILTLCREAVAFRSRLEVDGIICLTVDDQDQHIVKIHEFFDRNLEREATHPPPRTVSSEHHASSSRTIIRYAPNAQAEKEIPSQILPGMENTVMKTEPLDDTVSNQDMKPHVSSGQRDSPQETKSDSKHIDVNSLTSLDYTSMGLENLIMSSARNIHCKKCNSYLENVALFQVHNMTSHGQFTCLVCLATFTSRNNMKRHIRLHTGIKPYSCHKCPESFSRNDDFKRHLLKHTFRKPFRCAICNTGYSDRSGVKSHMTKDHNSKVFHICPQCGESYIDLQKYQQHKKCHPEFQDYRCSLCSFTGSNALMYNKHMLTHGPLKEYKCSYCNLSYSDPFMYTGHLKRHKGDELVLSYTCCFCDMSFPSFEQFQRHEHTHVHSKQHICNQCNKVFRYPSNLREHMLIHLPKFDFSGDKKSEHFERDTVQHPRNGENASETAVKQRHFVEEMDTDEENNNKINVELNVVDTQFPERDIVTGSNDYWCTECNQGFETENKLKNHITYKHEDKDLQNENDEEAVVQSDTLNTVKVTKPNTQTELQANNVYSEDTRLKLSTNPVYKDNANEDQQNHIANKNSISNAPLVFHSKQRHDVYDTETVIDTINTSTDSLNNEAADDNSTYHSDDITETKLNTVKDAMREVQNIQFRFGIKPKELERMGSDRKEVTKGMADDDVVVERSKSWSGPSSSNINLLGRTSRTLDSSMSVSVSGMKMKIQRTPNALLECSDNEERGKYSCIEEARNDDKSPDTKTDQKNIDNSIPCRQPPAPGTDNNFTVNPSRRSATTLNLQIRNPGFERVVTPDVLFSTKAPFTCELCEETFGSFDDFHDHGVKVHRRFICSYCGKVFTSRPNRERHIRYHTGEKPYKCDLCVATFLRGDDLKYHRTTKHADIKPFTCGACQTSFSLPKDLEKHLKIYSDHRL